MKTIPIKIWNRIDMLQQPIVAVARASASNRKRWVVIDLRRFSVVAQPPHVYCIIDTEFETELLKKYVDSWDTDLAIVSQARYYAADISELYIFLLKLEIDPESFRAPWHVEYPL